MEQRRTFKDGDGDGLLIERATGACSEHAQIWLANGPHSTGYWATPEQAREIAAHLIALADEIEGKTDPRVFAPVPDFGFDSDLGSADTVEVQR